MATHTEILAELKRLAPSVCFSISKEIDECEVWDGDGPDPVEDGYTPYCVDVVASAIVGGELIEGNNSLCGCYMADDEEIGDVHGYLPQMIEEAASELCERLHVGATKAELVAVCKYLKAEMRSRWEAQQADKA